MTGRSSSKKAKGKRQKSESVFTFHLFPFALPRDRRGFTLLELMIVITIIIILAAIALPQYQKTITAAREAVLRDDLFRMRSLLDQYAADRIWSALVTCAKCRSIRLPTRRIGYRRPARILTRPVANRA